MRLETGPERATGAARALRIVEISTAQKEALRVVPPPARLEPAAEPYRAYRPRPFSREERDRVTVLFGGLHWRAERVLQGAMERLGYRTRVLPTATREDLLAGRELADVGQCSPTSFTTGNLANFLRSEARRVGADRVVDEYIYVTAGACGACRFGQYHQSYELALRNLGLEAFRMFLLDQGLGQSEKAGGGLELDLPFVLGAIWAVMVTDVLQDLEYQTRPYECEAGATDRASREAVERLYEAFRRRPVPGKKLGYAAWHLATGYFVRALREVKPLYDAIEVDRTRVRPLVKITGEFYLQTVEGDPNYNIHRWLEAEGAEVYPAAVTIWLDYLLREAAQREEDQAGLRRGAALRYRGLRVAQRLLRWSYERMRRALGGVPRSLPDQYELRALAAPYYHAQLSGGEGDMLVGKALWAHLGRKAHMICELSPYACMPNTMSVGAMAAVTGRYPDLLYAPLEMKGDAEVHALSRCQMILTEAKRRAQREFEEVLARSRLQPGQLAAALERHAELRRATVPLPHRGVAGTAANLVLEVAARGLA